MGIFVDRRSDIARKPHDTKRRIAAGIVKATVTKRDQTAIQQDKTNGESKLDKQMAQNFNNNHGGASLLLDSSFIIKERAPCVNYILIFGLPNTRRKLTTKDAITQTTPMTESVSQLSTEATAFTPRISPMDTAEAAKQRRIG